MKHIFGGMIIAYCIAAPFVLFAQEEKLLLGFEKEEMEKIADACWKGNSNAKPPHVVPVDDKTKWRTGGYFADTKDAYGCHFGWYFGHCVGYNTYVIRKGKATQGEFAAVHDYKAVNYGSLRPYRSLGNWKEEFKKSKPGLYEMYAAYGKEFLAYMDFMLEWDQDYAMMGGRECTLLYTHRWFPRVFPADWSQFDVLRVDAQSTGVDVADLRIGLEDDYVEPLVYRTYELPAGKWVTLEYDLKEAAEKKRLDPAHMVNIFILVMRFKGDKAAPTSLLLDNVRLAKKGKGKTQETVITGKFWAYPEPPTLTVPKQAPKGAPPDRSPLKPEPPITIDLKALGTQVKPARHISSWGVVSAYDNNRILLVFEGPVRAICTKDGGKTWKGLDGSDKATDVTYPMSDPGGMGGKGEGGGYGVVGITQWLFGSYCEEDFPAPRYWHRGITFDGEGWKLGPPCFVTSEARHCYSTATLLTLEKGRIWTAIALPSRHGGRAEVVAMYSDDGGLTWRSWRGNGLSGKIDGTENANKGSSACDRWILLAPYGEHAACIFNKGGSLWSRYDGKAWSKPEPAGQGEPLSAVALGGKNDVLLLSTGKGVYRCTGGAWVQEAGAKGGGLLAAAGKDKCLLVNTWEAGKIAVQARRPDGSWGEPKAVAEEAGFSRHWTNFGVPQYSPPNFVPIVWMLPAQNTIKVLRVPVD